MTQAPQSSSTPSRLPACALALCLLLPARVAAQERTELAREATLRRSAAGAVVATLLRGAEVTPAAARGEWTRVTLEGWIFARSVGRTRREGYDLAVTAAGGENLRATPNGRVVARLRQGMLLDRLESRGDWIRVRRSGWIIRRALAGPPPVETGAVARASPAPAEPAPAGRTAPAKAKAAPKPKAAAERKAAPESEAGAGPTPEAGAPQGPAGATAQPPGAGASGAGTGPAPSRVEVSRATSLRATPGGDSIGSLLPGATAEVLGRAGDWARVQLEAWIPETDVGPARDGALVGVSAAEVRANPERYLGKVVEWRLQFIAIQTADELRSELPQGQPFLLTRGPLPEPGFVYVIIPRDRVAEFQGLAPLQELVLRVTLKAARTKYLATPVVELASVVVK